MQYNIKKLEENITDIIAESQLKLGYTDNALSLYYTPQSMALIVGGENDIGKITAAVNGYVTDYLGRLECIFEDDRYVVTIPAEGVEYVHNNVQPSDFLKEFIGAVNDGCSMEKAIDIFRKHSQSAVIEKAEDDEFDVLAYFSDEKPDKFLYCLADDLGGITYHRFTRQDYESIFHAE